MERNVKKWLREICRWDRVDWFVNVTEDGNGRFKCVVYTHDYKYGIVAIDKSDNEKGYLGCTVSTRKPRAGEDWTRGNDLPDGPYAYKTWQKIKNAILAYELVKVVRLQERVTDQVKELTSKKKGKKDDSENGCNKRSKKNNDECSAQKDPRIQNQTLDSSKIN